MNRDGDPDLSLHSVLAGAVERFDAKVLFDPFEKLVSQNQTKPGGAKKRRLHFKSKKSKCHLSRWVTDSYVDMRIRQPDSSDLLYSPRLLVRIESANLCTIYMALKSRFVERIHSSQCKDG